MCNPSVHIGNVTNWPSEGARQLRLTMASRKLRQSDVAETLGCQQSQVSRLLSGARKPSLEMALVMAREWGIAASLWGETATESGPGENTGPAAEAS